MYLTKSVTKFLINAEIKIADFACQAAGGLSDGVFLSFDQSAIPLKTIMGDELPMTLGCRWQVKRF